MHFAARNSPATYRELLPRPDNPEDDNAQGLFGLSTGLVLYLLKVQDRMYEFLVTCCRLILHDHAATELLNQTVPIQPEVQPIPELAADLHSMAMSAQELPYRAPSGLNLERLKVLVSSKLYECEDHIWRLREDPSFFAESIIADTETFTDAQYPRGNF